MNIQTNIDLKECSMKYIIMIEPVTLLLFGVFTLYLGFIGLKLANMNALTTSAREKNKLDIVKLKSKLSEEFSDRPRPYIFRFITVPINNEADNHDGIDTHYERDDIINGGVHVQQGNAVAKFSMFVSKPSCVFKKLKKVADVDWNNETFILLNYEVVDVV